MKKSFLIVFALLLVISCNKDKSLYTNNIYQEVDDTFETIRLLKDKENNRVVLSFDDKEHFQGMIEGLNQKDEKTTLDFFDGLYNKGFHSLIPFVDSRIVENDYEQKYFDEVIKPIHKSIENFEKAYAKYEALIGDELFAAFLNENAEIIVADTLYKYTDKGLFIAHKDHRKKIYNHLDNNSNTKYRRQGRVCGYYAVDSYVSRYISPYRYCDDIDISGPYHNPMMNYYARKDQIAQQKAQQQQAAKQRQKLALMKFMSNMPTCSDNNNLWNNITRLFGDNVQCNDYFERKRRIKTAGFKSQMQLFVKQ